MPALQARWIVGFSAVVDPGISRIDVRLGLDDVVQVGDLGLIGVGRVDDLHRDLALERRDVRRQLGEALDLRPPVVAEEVVAQHERVRPAARGRLRLTCWHSLPRRQPRSTTARAQAQRRGRQPCGSASGFAGLHSFAPPPRPGRSPFLESFPHPLGEHKTPLARKSSSRSRSAPGSLEAGERRRRAHSEQPQRAASGPPPWRPRGPARHLWSGTLGRSGGARRGGGLQARAAVAMICACRQSPHR